MSARPSAAWPGTLAILGLAGTLLGAPELSARPDGYMRMPSASQVLDYNTGVDTWRAALARKSPQERGQQLERAERKLESATRGKETFPEAILALGYLRYARQDPAGAQAAFTEVAQISQGSLRAQALTYLGVLALGQQRFADAEDHFRKALLERDNQTTTTAVGRRREEVLDLFREEQREVECAARAGLVLAAFYQLGEPGDPARHRALLDELQSLLPEEVVNACAGVFDGRAIALYRFPAAPARWSGANGEGQIIPLKQLVESLSLHSQAALGLEPSGSITPTAELPEGDRRNLLSARVRRAERLESTGDLAGALGAWTQLAPFPETALMARQHRIWILLRQAGASRDFNAHTAAVRELIRGPQMAEDPLLYDQQLALAGAVLERAMQAQPPRADLVEAGQRDLQTVLSGFPGMGGRMASEAQRRLAEQHLAVLALARPESSGPASWEAGLAAYPPAPGRERIRLQMAQRWALALLRAGESMALMRALERGDEIAAGREGRGTVPVPGGPEQMRLFRRYLARLLLDRNAAAAAAHPLLQQTDFGAELRASLAAEEFGAWRAGVTSRPETIVDAAAAWQRIVQHLQEARALSGGNTALQQRLDGDLRASRTYLERIQAAPPRLLLAWNEAASRTNVAARPEEWDQAAGRWRDVLVQLSGRPPEERTEAATHVVHAYLRKADVLHRAGDSGAALLALRQARSALASGGDGVGAYLTPQEKKLVVQRVDNNALSLRAGERLLPASIPIRPFAGGTIPPVRARCMIICYPAAHRPSVSRWLAELRRNGDATRRLVDWFNNGPMARSTPDAKRDFSADPRSPRYLVAYLERNIHPVPVHLPAGSIQWCDHNGKGPWHSARVSKDAAAYALRNGLRIINAACSNPLAPIRATQVRATWVDTTETARSIPLPDYPSLAYARPQADFTFPAPPGVTVPPMNRPPVAHLPLTAPAISLVLAPDVMPKLAVPDCYITRTGTRVDAGPLRKQ